MEREEIEKISTEEYDDKIWKPLINLFWDRYNKRYFDQIDILKKHEKSTIRNNCGFLIVTIDCVLIETLEQFYCGSDETKGKNHEPFESFFERRKEFAKVIKSKEDAGLFAGLIRSGLLHQSKTKKESIINIKTKTKILKWIDEKDKRKGFKINRNKFHDCVKAAYENLIKELKEEGSKDLRKNFRDKMLTIF